VLLLAVVSYAAWHFGSAGPADDPTAKKSKITEVIADHAGSEAHGVMTAAENPDATQAVGAASDHVMPPTNADNTVEAQTAADERLDTGENIIGKSTAGKIQESQGYSQPDSPQNAVKDIPEGTRETDSDPAMVVASADITETDTRQVPDRPMPDQTMQAEPRPDLSSNRAENNSSHTTHEAPIGTGVAVVSIGDRLLADAATDYIRQILERHGIAVLDGITMPGVASMLENGSNTIEELLRPHARYLVFIRADYNGQRELYYMGRHDTEYQARLSVETHDMLDGRAVGPAIHASIAYTQLSVNTKVEEIIRPKFGPTADDLKE
jgi:hypothetical protein